MLNKQISAKGEKMKRKITLIALLSTFAISGCQSKENGMELKITEPATEQLSVEQTSENDENTENELSQYTDTEAILKKFKNEPMGADGFLIYCAYDKYAVIEAYNGTLIFDFDNYKICGGIDNGALGMDHTQGSDATTAISDVTDTYVFLYKASDIHGSKANGYKYSIPEHTLSYVENEPLGNYVSHMDWVMEFSGPNYMRNDEPSDYIKLENLLCNNDEKSYSEGDFVIEGIAARPRENDIAVFAYGHIFGEDNERIFKLYIMSKKDFQIIKSYDFDV